MKLKSPLPQRDGVAASFVWLPQEQWPSLLAFFAHRFPNVESLSWQARMLRGEVVDERGTVLHADSPFRPGACVFYYREPPPETAIPFDELILHQDTHLLVVDKPHFLPVIPGGRFLRETLLVRLKQKLGLEHLAPIHRLDRETAGIILFSLNPASSGRYQALFRERQIEKVYEALAPTRADLAFPMTRGSRIEKGEPFFVMREVAGTANAHTQIDLLENLGDISRYALRPLTGRQHQLRVHMAAIGAPIVGDTFYPHALPCKGDDFSQPLKLLARQLSFTDPVDGQPKLFTSQRQL